MTTMATSRPSLSKKYPKFELLSCLVDSDGNLYYIARNLETGGYSWILNDWELENPFMTSIGAYGFCRFHDALKDLMECRELHGCSISGTHDIAVCFVQEAL